MEMIEYYPFEVYEEDNNVYASITNEQQLADYHSFFGEYGYEGNGYFWTGCIIQILEIVEPGLLDKIEFDPEANGFYAYLDNTNARAKFLEILCPIFNDRNLLTSYVQKLDRDRIDD